jgi:hypothetical protein
MLDDRPCNGDTDPQPRLQSHGQSKSLHSACKKRERSWEQVESQFHSWVCPKSEIYRSKVVLMLMLIRREGPLERKRMVANRCACMCPRCWASSRPLPKRLQPAQTRLISCSKKKTDFNTTSATLSRWPLPGTRSSMYSSYLVSRCAGAEDEPLREITPGNRRRRRQQRSKEQQQRNREHARATTIATRSQLHYKNHRRQPSRCLLARFFSSLSLIG